MQDRINKPLTLDMILDVRCNMSAEFKLGWLLLTSFNESNTSCNPR